MTDASAASRPASANRERSGQMAQSARNGRTESREGLIMAATPHRAPYPSHRRGLSEPRIDSVASKRNAIHKVASAVSHTQTTEKYSDVGRKTQVQAAAFPVALPNVLLPIA